MSRHSMPSFSHLIHLTAFAMALIGIVAQPATAQTPAKGVIGYGVDVGVLIPDGAFENTLDVDVHGEYYLTPRVSVRALFGVASPGVVGVPESSFRQIKLLFGGLYNWQYHDWRPFAGAGAGAYFVQLRLAGLTDPEGETRGGINFGGGTEYVLSDDDAIKVELRWDVISDPPGLSDASGLSFTVGYKRFF